MPISDKNDLYISLFLRELKEKIEDESNDEEIIDTIIEAFNAGVFDSEIEYDHRKYIDRYEADLEEKVYNEIKSNINNASLTDRLRRELKKELLEKEKEDILDEIEDDIEDELREKIYKNFKLILKGDNKNDDFELIFDLAQQELKKILLSKKEFMSSITGKIKSEIMHYLQSEYIPKEYDVVISNIKKQIKNEMRKDESITKKITAEIMDELTSKIFDN